MTATSSVSTLLVGRARYIMRMLARGCHVRYNDWTMGRGHPCFPGRGHATARGTAECGSLDTKPTGTSLMETGALTSTIGRWCSFLVEL